MPSDQVRILARERNGLTWMNFNGADDQRLVVDAFPLTLRRAANQRLVHLNGVLTADQVPVRAHHRSAQLVEHLEGCLIASTLAISRPRREGREVPPSDSDGPD